MKKILIAICMIISIMSCEKTVVVNVPTQASKLVINGLINAGDVFKLKVSNAYIIPGKRMSKNIQ